MGSYGGSVYFTASPLSTSPSGTYCVQRREQITYSHLYLDTNFYRVDVHNIGDPWDQDVFDIKWNCDDSLLGTSSRQHHTIITDTTTNQKVYELWRLDSESEIVNTIAWNPVHRCLLTTGGRDGAIKAWDIRRSMSRGAVSCPLVFPISRALGAHKRQHIPYIGDSEGSVKWEGSGATVTALLYSSDDTHTIISSGSEDG